MYIGPVRDQGSFFQNVLPNYLEENMRMTDFFIIDFWILRFLYKYHQHFVGIFFSVITKVCDGRHYFSFLLNRLN